MRERVKKKGFAIDKFEVVFSHGITVELGNVG